MSGTSNVRHLTRTLLALAAWIALILQFVVSRSLTPSMSMALIAMFGYFTVITNLFVAIVATASVFARGSARAAWLAQPALLGCASAAILLVGLAYHFLLRHVWDPQGLAGIADVALHYVVPVLALLHVLALRIDGRTTRLGWWLPIAWCSYPAVYLGISLWRGESTGRYAYPFIDVGALGLSDVMFNSLGLLAVFLVLGYAVWALLRRFRR